MKFCDLEEQKEDEITKNAVDRERQFGVLGRVETFYDVNNLLLDFFFLFFLFGITTNNMKYMLFQNENIPSKLGCG